MELRRLASASPSPGVAGLWGVQRHTFTEEGYSGLQKSGRSTGKGPGVGPGRRSTAAATRAVGLGRSEAGSGGHRAAFPDPRQPPVLVLVLVSGIQTDGRTLPAGPPHQAPTLPACASPPSTAQGPLLRGPEPADPHLPGAPLEGQDCAATARLWDCRLGSLPGVQADPGHGHRSGTAVRGWHRAAGEAAAWGARSPEPSPGSSPGCSAPSPAPAPTEEARMWLLAPGYRHLGSELSPF